MFNLQISMIEQRENITIDFAASVSIGATVSRWHMWHFFVESQLLRSYGGNGHKRPVFSSMIYGGHVEDDHIPFLNYGKDRLILQASSFNGFFLSRCTYSAFDCHTIPTHLAYHPRQWSQSRFSIHCSYQKYDESISDRISSLKSSRMLTNHPCRVQRGNSGADVYYTFFWNSDVINQLIRDRKSTVLTT